jgi:[ribosomal protein S5]-alanine N-acetyltransferase
MMTDRLPNKFETPRLVLRPIAAGDAPAIYAGYAQDAEVVRYLIWQPHRNISETEAYIADCLSAAAERECTYALTGRGDGSLLGAFALRRGPVHRLDCGYVLARAHWGQGLMSEALAAVADWAMAQPDIWRIGAVCDIDNRASARVMEKAGMRREGVLARWLIHPNIGPEPRDCYSYARVR